MHTETKEITDLILKAAEKARLETSDKPERPYTQPIQWPVECTVGPGLEGAIACETKIGYVNGAKGSLLYRGYDIFDLCAYSTYEQVSYLLLHGNMPNQKELDRYKKNLAQYRFIPKTQRLLMNFPIEDMNTMAAMRLGTTLLRQEITYADRELGRPDITTAIGTDEDSIPMETKPMGEKQAIYEFKSPRHVKTPPGIDASLEEAHGLKSCYHLIATLPTLAGTITRIRDNLMPKNPELDLSHAANLLYVLTGRIPTPLEERIMDICLILHADHGMNASTFASMVVASTLSDMYLSIGSGIAALNGPLHGGANEQVLTTLLEIGDAGNVEQWFKKQIEQKNKIMGFGHRVYKAYDPRARILGPIAKHLSKKTPEASALYTTAETLEKLVVKTLGKEKKIFPNVDFYSGLVYASMGINQDMFTPLFAVSRAAGWTARVHEYLKNNRIFRPRAIYKGPFDSVYVPIQDRK